MDSIKHKIRERLASGIPPNPEMVRYLLAEIDRLKAENKRLTKNIEAYLKGEQQDQSHG